MAAAIILIPEMLSGPKRATEAPASRQSEGFKTYTIDLNRSPGASVEDRAPPPEEGTPAPETTPEEAPPVAAAPPVEKEAADAQASPESTRVEPLSSERTASAPPPQVSPPTEQPITARERQDAAPQASPAPAGAQPPVMSTTAVPTSKGWAIQLGSFSSRATAESLAKDFTASGRHAFVMPVKSGANTLYRVRIGPFGDRAAANAALAGVKQRVANAAVVAHP